MYGLPISTEYDIGTMVWKCMQFYGWINSVVDLNISRTVFLKRAVRVLVANDSVSALGPTTSEQASTKERWI